MDFLGAEPPVDEPPSRMEGDMVIANPMIKVEIDYNVLGLVSTLHASHLCGLRLILGKSHW